MQEWHATGGKGILATKLVQDRWTTLRSYSDMVSNAAELTRASSTSLRRWKSRPSAPLSRSSSLRSSPARLTRHWSGSPRLLGTFRSYLISSERVVLNERTSGQSSRPSRWIPSEHKAGYMGRHAGMQIALLLDGILTASNWNSCTLNPMVTSTFAARTSAILSTLTAASFDRESNLLSAQIRRLIIVSLFAQSSGLRSPPILVQAYSRACPSPSPVPR